MMNKRNTEGYVLAYVLIVVTVMGLIAATLITSTLQVIQAQENSIEYMKDKYAAMGEVEKQLAQLEVQLETKFPHSDSGFSSRDNANSAAEDYLKSKIGTSVDLDGTNCKFSLTSSCGTVSTHLCLPYNIEISQYSLTDPNDSEKSVIKYEYTLTVSSLDYLSYVVSSESLGGGT